MLIAKQRHGPIGTTSVRFDEYVIAFSELQQYVPGKQGRE